MSGGFAGAGESWWAEDHIYQYTYGNFYAGFFQSSLRVHAAGVHIRVLFLSWRIGDANCGLVAVTAIGSSQCKRDLCDLAGPQFPKTAVGLLII